MHTHLSAPKSSSTTHGTFTISCIAFSKAHNTVYTFEPLRRYVMFFVQLYDYLINFTFVYSSPAVTLTLTFATNCMTSAQYPDRRDQLSTISESSACNDHKRLGLLSVICHSLLLTTMYPSSARYVLFPYHMFSTDSPSSADYVYGDWRKWERRRRRILGRILS